MRSFSFALGALLGLSSALPALAQTKTNRARVDWGPELSDKEHGYFDEVVGSTDTHVYMTVYLKKKPHVRKMDLNHKAVWQKEIPLELGKDEHDLKEVVLFGDKILVFTSHTNKKEKTSSVYLRVFSSDGFSPIGKLERLASADYEKRSNQSGFTIRVSADHQYALLSELLPYDKEGSEKFRLRVYDKDMQLSWDRNVELPYKDSEFSVMGTRVMDDGSVLMVGNKYAEKREAKELRKDGKATYEYRVLVFKADGGREEYPIEVKDKFLQDLTLSVGKEGDIICGGLYGKKGSFATAGTFFLKLDRRTKEVIHSSFKEFDKEFITSYMTEKEEKKAEKRAARKGEDLEMYNFDLHDIIRRDDGGAVIIAEQFNYYTVTTCSTTPNGGQICTTSHHYVYNDIIVVNVDPKGDIEWAAKVPKRQHTVNDGGKFSSFAVTVKGENIYLLFNDHGKNLFLSPGEKIEPMRLGKELVITLATIGPAGQVHREALLAMEKREAITMPKKCVQVADDRLFIYADWKREHRFGSVMFN